MYQWDEWGYFSAVALLLWIPFSLWLFTFQRPNKAALHSVIWGMMWLPEGAAFDLPALPPFSKYAIGALCALLGLWWKAPKRLRAARIGRGYDLWVIVLLLSQFGTVLTNPDPLHYGTYKTIDLPGFTPYDGLSAAVRVAISVGVPCVLGRALFRTRQDLLDAMGVLVVAGLVYSVPIFIELRLSPILHERLYGFAARTDWSQNVRAGGYRATVFMGHGLVVGFFMFMCTTCAFTLHKAGKRQMLGLPMWSIVSYLCVVLLFCKAAAAIIYGAVGFCVVRWLSSKAQMRVLAALALVVVSYPLSRMFEFFPVAGLISAAKSLGPDRVQSLQFRFDNEDILLLKASQRLWFGWGGFGRDRVYDADSAKDIVIQDGHWIALFGHEGLVGFVCFFALMLLPVLYAARQMRQVKLKSDQTLLAGFGFIVVVCSVNMLPNMQLPYLQFIFALGFAVLMKELPRQASDSLRPTPAPVDGGNSSRPRRRGLQSAA